MDIRTRLIAPTFRRLDDGRIGPFNLDALIKRILLFETYIVDSQGLNEIPPLVEAFTLDGLFLLLESGALKLNCRFSNTGSLSQTLPNGKVNLKELQSPFQYKFVTMEPAEINQYVNLLLSDVESKLELSSRQKIHLRKAIYSSLEKPADIKDSQALRATKEEINSSPNILKSALAIALYNYLGKEAELDKLEIFVEFETENDFVVDANIGKLFDLDQFTARKIIESACLSIAKRNDRIELMRSYSALTGFSDIDLPIFSERLEFLASSLSPDIQENRFQRVLELTGLPQVRNNQNIQIDAKQLLKIRDSIECVEFRQWLATTDATTDDDVIHQVRSLSKTIGRFIGGELGQNIRFLITNGIGFIPVAGQVVSIPLSILDHFLLEKIFPRSGISAFVDDMYPSIFENR